MNLLLSQTVTTLVDIDGLRAALGRLGVRATTDINESRPDAIVATRLDGALMALAHERAIPLLVLRESWTLRGLSIEEHAGGDPDGIDRRPLRLFRSFASRLTAETESAAADAVTPFVPDDPFSEAVFLDDDAAIWRALAQGRDVVCARRCFATELGLAHGSTDSRDVRRNVRDRTRAALAVDYLFNAIPPDPMMLAAPLAEAARSLADPPCARVSVIITAFNYSDFVADAVASAQNQTLRPHEIIVVNDGSTDRTGEILSDLRDIVVVTKENGGQASAFNAGFAVASGEVVIFLDGDDLLDREAVERAARFDFTGVSRLQYLLETVDRAGRPTGLHAASHRAAAGDLSGALRSDGAVWFMPTSGNAFPRSVLERLLPMPEAGFEIAADLYLVFGAACVGRTAHLPEVLGQYRVHGRNAYFHARAGAPYHKEKRHAQRTRTWRALLDALPALAPERAAEIAADLRRLLREDVREEMPDPSIDPVGAAGKANWPLVQTGDRFGFLGPEAGASPLGAGWSDPGPLGAIPRQSTVQIAVILPPPEADWSLRIGYRADTPIEGVTFHLGGRMIDTMDLLATGTLSLRLPSFLLTPDVSGFRRALVTICFAAETGAAFGLNELRFDMLCGTGKSAPVLREGRWHRLGPGSRAACGMGRGWDWPGAEGAFLAAQTAHLSFSFPRAAQRILFLDWTGPGVPQVMCRGARLGVTRAALTGVTIVDVPAVLGPEVDLELVFAEVDKASRLRAVAWVATEAGALPPGAIVPAQDILDVSPGAAARVGLTPRGIVPWAGGARLQIRRPPLPDGGIVALHLGRKSDPAEPLRCRIAVDGQRSMVTVGAETRLPFALTGVGEEIVVELDVEDGVDDLILASMIWDAAPPTPGGQVGSAGVPDPAPFWHPAADGVRWLGAMAGDLLLPELPCTTAALAVGTLTLEEPFEQQLRVALVGSAGDVLSEALSPPGLGEVLLPVPEDARRGLRLRVTTDHLVSADLVGADAGQVLGGAITSLAAR